MALKPCPECGNEISTTATTCPRCGYEAVKSFRAKNRQTGRFFEIAFVTVALIVIAYFVLSVAKSPA